MSRITNALLALTENTRLGNALQELLLVNRFEAAQPNSPKRPHIPAFVQDAKYDETSFSRWEMLRKIRYEQRNCWLIQAIQEQHVNWTVGPDGMRVVPASSDTEWNKAIEESYLEWCESPCYDSVVPMPEVHKQIAAAHHLESEIFILKTFVKEQGKQSKPAIQLIESHRCSSPGQGWTNDISQDIVDGVQLARYNGKIGGPTGYWILDDSSANTWVFRRKEDCYQVFSPYRNNVRPVTRYHAVLNTVQDLELLESMEMDRAKLNSEIANIITNAAGELRLDDKRAIRLPLRGQTPPVNPAEDNIDKRILNYSKVLGAKTIALKTGETLTQNDTNNPSAATQWYWRLKMGQVCTAGGVDLILIFPELIESIQGTVVRGIYDNAHVAFRKQFFIYKRAALDMYRYYVQWARYNDPRCVDAPADWRKAHVIPPRAVNVDIGNNSAAMLAELNAGVTNYDDIAGGHSTTAQELLMKKGNNILMIKRIAAELSNNKEGITIDPAEIAGPLAPIIQALALADQASAEDEDDDGDGVKKKTKSKPAAGKKPEPTNK